MLSVIFGVAGFAFAFWYMAMNPSTEFHGYIDKPALVLLTVAPISIIFISHNFFDFLAGIRTLFSMAFINQKKEMNNIVNMLSQLSQSVRNEGMGALVQFKDRIKNQLFKDGVTLILNNFTPQEIKHNLVAKINNKQSSFQHAANIFECLAKLSPGMGLLGTIIGLVQMLANLQDPSKIGASMAAALLATLYGLVFGNVIYMPIAEKLNVHAEKMLQMETMIMEGVLLLKEKKSGAHLRDVVSTYSHNRGNGHAVPGQPAAAGISPKPGTRVG